MPRGFLPGVRSAETPPPVCTPRRLFSVPQLEHAWDDELKLHNGLTQTCYTWKVILTIVTVIHGTLLARHLTAARPLA